MKYFSTGILMSMLVAGAMAQVDFLTALTASFNYVFTTQAQYANPLLYRGTVRGIQQNPNNLANQCYISYLNLEGQISGLPGFVASIASGTASDNTIMSSITTLWYEQPGNYAVLAKYALETSSAFFNFYE